MKDQDYSPNLRPIPLTLYNTMDTALSFLSMSSLIKKNSFYKIGGLVFSLLEHSSFRGVAHAVQSILESWLRNGLTFLNRAITLLNIKN